MEKVYDWNKADLFHRGAENSRRDAQQALQEYAHLIKWRLDGKDSMLDAGCGPGNITRDVILPFLPGTFERLVGVDISNEMINYARATQIHPKLSFELFNLDMELEKQPLNNIKPFDHIFSCYCMMYVKDHNLCLRNFYKLLKPGGDTLLLLLTYTPIYDLYKQQSEDSRWSKYMHDVDNSKVPYQNSKNAEDEFRTILVNAGFTECDVKLHKKGFVFNSDAMHSKNNYLF